MITIRPSSLADSVVPDRSAVSKDLLELSSIEHIDDVRQALDFFIGLLAYASVVHDRDKLSDIDGFHDNFTHNFTAGHQDWWKRHRKLNRHHLADPDGVPNGVNLIDVLDYIADCVMSGLAQRGHVRPVTIDIGVLERAFANTVQLLKQNVEVVP